ncbi:MAG: hypothetical protein AMJ53_02235 [Gammaproteobacteria bacterium SG8_11]|nr:MAG: hypothetical protein AMJ53_02235 [Gammaproteobacteria bacterium SG8_11]
MLRKRAAMRRLLSRKRRKLRKSSSLHLLRHRRRVSKTSRVAEIFNRNFKQKWMLPPIFCKRWNVIRWWKRI